MGDENLYAAMDIITSCATALVEGRRWETPRGFVDAHAAAVALSVVAETWGCADVFDVARVLRDTSEPQ